MDRIHVIVFQFWRIVGPKQATAIRWRGHHKETFADLASARRHTHLPG